MLRLLADLLRGPLDPGCGRWLPGGQVMAAAGIAFAFVKKGGLGIAGMRGHGFVIRKVCNPLLQPASSTKQAALMAVLQWPLARHAPSRAANFLSRRGRRRHVCCMATAVVHRKNARTTLQSCRLA